MPHPHTPPLVCVVTGAASGIGQACAAALLAAGHTVWAADLPSQLAHLSDGLKPLPLDVRDEAAWAAALGTVQQQSGRIDLLVNNAGVLRAGAAHEATAADVEFHMAVNVRGVMLGTQAAARLMRGQRENRLGRKGQVVNIASLAGIAPGPGLALYCASKFAVRGYTLSIAHELKALGIATTVVCPDAVQTPMLTAQVGEPHAALTFSGSRVLTAQEVAAAIAGRVLQKAPLEVRLPAARGWLGMFGNVFPGLAQGLYAHFIAKGRKAQAQRRL